MHRFIEGSTYSPTIADTLHVALERCALERDASAPELGVVLGALCEESRARKLPAHEISQFIRKMWHQLPRPDEQSPEAWGAILDTALDRALTLHFAVHDVRPVTMPSA